MQTSGREGASERGGDRVIVLRRVEYGDADLIFTLFSRERGRLSAIARSARRSKRRYGASLGSLAVSRAMLQRRDGAELWTWASSDLIRAADDLALDLVAMAHASYGAELCRELLAAEEPEPAVFDLLEELLTGLRADGPRPARLRAFENRLLGLLGLAPRWISCSSCDGAPLERGAIFDADRGGAVCRRCATTSRGPGTRPLDPEIATLLADLQEIARLADADLLEAAPERWTGAREVMAILLHHHIGKPLRSLEYIAKLGAGLRAADLRAPGGRSV